MARGTILFATVRILLGCVGATAFVGGLFLVTQGGDLAAAGVWPIIVGGVLLVAVVLERQRYRSTAADRTHESAGPGGGEPNGMPARFLPTEERFLDPTSGRVMRVFLDEHSGERRYRAEA